VARPVARDVEVNRRCLKSCVCVILSVPCSGSVAESWQRLILNQRWWSSGSGRVGRPVARDMDVDRRSWMGWSSEWNSLLHY